MTLRQAHIVGRQLMEVTLGTEDRAREVQDRLSRVQRRVEGTLAQMLDAAEAQTGPLRIDRLQLDLGTLRADRLEADLLGAVARALPAALHATAGTAEGAGAEAHDSGRSDLHLVEMALEHGRLPWWADPADPHALAAAIARALADNPERLLALLRRQIARRAAARRLAAGVAPRQISVIAGLLAGAGVGFAAVTRKVAAGLLRAAPAGARAGQRRDLWVAILETATGGVPTSRRSFWQSVIARLAGMQGTTAAELAASFRPPAAGSVARTVFDDLQAEAGPALRTPPYTAALDALDARFPTLRPLWALIADAAVRSGSAAFAADIARLAQGSAPPPPELIGGILGQAIRSGLVRTQAVATALESAAEAAPPDLRRLVEAAATEAGAAEWSAPAGTAQQQAPAGPRAREGHEVMTAGLPMLWPFLKRFFDRLGLLDGDAFAGIAARDRAIGLLHYAATGDPDPPEFQLAPAKLLCGAAPDEPWLPDSPVEATAREECELLLDAVIAQAPGFGQISRDGLRGSFLIRRGMLYPDPGGWLLTVERLSHDILLDRLAWPIRVVKLPWMPEPLQVDW